MSASITKRHGLLMCLCAAAAVLTLAGPVSAAEQSPIYTGTHVTNDQDRQAIQAVLDTYTRAVNTGDQALFESQLLDQKIPFFGLGGTLKPSFKPSLASVQDYAGFQQGVFKSGQKFSQRFFNIKIDQDGDLAQVSLNFENAAVDDSGGGNGWKTIQLLKVAGHWKIASEFYTVYATKAE